jgi:hypothetical protein
MNLFPLKDLPEFFEDNMKIWMENFHTLLTTDVKCLQTSVSYFLNHYTAKHFLAN